MNAKKIFALILSVLMVVSCLSAAMFVSAEETDKFAPTNEESIQMYAGEQGSALGSYGKGNSFGAMFTVESGKRLTQINFHALATYSSNVNHIVFKVYQWDTDYATTVKGDVLAQTTILNHTDNAPLDVILPTNRNLTGELLFTATYVDGQNAMTPWSANNGDASGAVDGVTYFANGGSCAAYCFSITVGDELTATPASYTATFMADGAEVAKVTFLEGDKELMNIPEIPAKEGFYADWEKYTLADADITINAVYSDASDAIQPEIPDATNVTAFAEDHITYLRGEQYCSPKVNRDGSVTFTGAWSVDGDIDAIATINYLQMMKKYYVNFDGNSSIPNKTHKYNVVVLKVKADPVCLDSTPNMTVTVGRDTEIYGMEVANNIKCDGTEEYWIFDFTDEKDFQSDVINTMKINWAYSIGEESNLGAEFTILGFQFFNTMEDALNATGAEEATEAPTEEPTEAPETTPAPETTATVENQPSTQPVEDEGCGAVIGTAAAATVLVAAAAAVALKKKD